MVDSTDIFRKALESHSEQFAVQLSSAAIARLSDYFQILNKWNPRLHLVAPCSPEEFATRHILESLLLVPHLPEGATIADIGSGAGLPIIPNLIVRDEITATLIESSARKAVFLREALKETATGAQASVTVERFEQIAVPEVGFITCRALESFQELLPHIVSWAPPESVLLLFGGPTLEARLNELGLVYSKRQVPLSERRFLFEVPARN